MIAFIHHLSCTFYDAVGQNILAKWIFFYDLSDFGEFYENFD